MTTYQLSSNCPVSDGFRASMNAWLEDFFSKQTSVYSPIQLVSKTLQKRTNQHKQKESNISDLLENIEVTFSAIKKPFEKASWINHDTAIGLRRLGVHVPHPWLMPWTEESSVSVDVSDKKFPGMLAVSMGAVNEKRSDNCLSPQIVAAIRHNKLPAYVEHRSGVPYEFAYAVVLDGKTFWVRMFVVVNNESGEVSACDELLPQQITIKTKTNEGRRLHGGKSVSFTCRKWSSPTIIDMHNSDEKEVRRIAALNIFAAAFSWWKRREHRWSVAVKKGGDRLTFCVEKENTKTFFADRDKSVKTPSGATKKILHFVNEHKRVIGNKTTTVKSHIRGAREFDWNGYHCIITPPKFGILSSEFDIPSEEETDVAKPNMIAGSKLGLMLAQIEERTLDKDKRKKP